MSETREEVQEQIRQARGEFVRDGKVRFDVHCHDKKERITFRVPDLIDLADLDEALPVLPVPPVEADDGSVATAMRQLEEIFSDPPRAKNFMRRADKLLLACAMAPVLVPETLLETEPGTLSVRSIGTTDRSIVFQALMGLAGYSGEAAAAVVPFAETDSCSKPSTQSGNGTAPDPARSSTPEEVGTPTST